MAEIDEALAAAMSSRDYDQAILARLIGEPEAIRDYLQQVYIANAARAAVVAVGERLSALAEIAAMFGHDGVHEHHRALAEGLAGMDKSFQRQLLVEEVLPESRTSSSLAGVVRQMGFYEVSKLFVDGVTTGEADKAELVRAIRGLALISPSERQEIVQMAGSVMLNAGMSEAEIAEVLEAATPTRLTVRPESRRLQGRGRRTPSSRCWTSRWPRATCSKPTPRSLRSRTRRPGASPTVTSSRRWSRS